MNINKIELGTRIKAIRKKQDMTLEEFGRVIGNAGKSNVSKWEKGLAIPNDERLEIIARLANASVNKLLYGSTLSFVTDRIGAYLPNEYVFLDGLFNSEHLVILSNLIDKKKISLDDSESIKRIVGIIAPEVEDDLLIQARQSISRIIRNMHLLPNVYFSDRTGYFHQKFSNEGIFINHMYQMGSSNATDVELIQSLPILKNVAKELESYQRTEFQFTEMPTISLSLPLFLDTMNIYELPMDGKFISHVTVKTSQADNISETLSIFDERRDCVYVVPKISEPEDITRLFENNKDCFVVIGYQCYCGKLIDETHLSVDGTVIDISNHRFISRLLAVLY